MIHVRSPHPRLRNQAVRGVRWCRAYFWGTYVKRTFISAAAILAFAATAHADELTDIQAQAKQLREQNATMTKRLADLEKRQKALETQKPVAVNPVDAMAADLPYKAAVKARPVESDDICLHGICVYGNFDMGLTWIQHSAPFSAPAAGPLDTLVSKNGAGSYFGAGVNQMSTSFLGLRGKQEIGDNLFAVFNLQTLFNPATGMNANGTGTIAQNSGLGDRIGFQNSFGDSSKGGQMFNNAAYFGLSSPTYGTLTLGRQSALSSDLIVNYDPLSGSNSWSVITFQGANGGGGRTENRIYDNSYEYRLNVGPVRLAAEAQLAQGGNSAVNNAFEGNIGFDYMGLSMDVLGGKIFGAVGGAALTQAQLLSANNAGALTNGVAVTNGPYGMMGVTVSDNTVFQVAARYTIGPWKLFGGYENIHFANPQSGLAPGAFLQGGMVAATVNNCNFGAVIGGVCVNNNEVLQTVWFGVRYAVTPTLDITGAYYHEWQNNFATAAGTITNCTIQGSLSSQCAGTLDAVSFALDWRFARHVDMYAGVMWSQVNGGLASGFLNANGTNAGGVLTNGRNSASNIDPGIGLRYQF